MPIILLLPVAIVICGFGSQRWLWLTTGGLLLFLWLY